MEPTILKEQTKALNWQVITYLKAKSSLSSQQISRKLLAGQTFDIPGSGTLLDNTLIEKVLNQNDFYEKQSQKQLKQAALKFVKTNVQEWSTNIAKIQRKINKEQLPKYTAKVLAFGSYVLDLKSNSSDIDLICVVPHFINRQTHFFEVLAEKLESDSQVKGLSVRKTAKVPIITFDFKEINIDISFCKLPTEEVPRNIQRVITMDLLNSIEDDTSKLSLLGRKNNLMILQLAGKAQEQNFKTTLRIIKVWAKNRGISSNGMGFLGGISWAILLAKICQIFPHHKPIKLLLQFFNIYRLWKWKDMPVQLIQPQDKENTVSEKSMMTIITPGSYVNSTERVNQITFQIIAGEIEKGSEILNYNNDLWTLCSKADFIREYPMFIEIDICGRNETKEQQKDFKDFQGSVQAKILYLLSNFIKFNKKEFEAGLKIVPHPKLYKKNDPTFELCNAFFLGIKTQGTVDLYRAVSEWCRMLSDSRQRKGKQEHLNVRIFECKKEDFLEDVEINETKKKEEKEDPRLALRRRAG